jgi:hypothetical protein
MPSSRTESIHSLKNDMNSQTNTKEPLLQSTVKSKDAELFQQPVSQKDRDIMILEMDVQRHSNRLLYDRTLSPEGKEALQKRLADKESKLQELRKGVCDG